MIDRRALIALATTLPLTGKQFRQNTHGQNATSLDTNGVRVLGISPDGSTLVGQRESEQVCLLDSASGEMIFETEPTPELAWLDPQSFSWSPDGSHLAFSLDSDGFVQDSDIYVLNTSGGELLNATSEGFESVVDRARIDAEVHMDVYPVWLDNGTLLFFRRSNPQRPDDITVQLMHMTWPDVEIEPRVDLLDSGVTYLTGPARLLSDGRVVMGVMIEIENRGFPRIVVVEPDQNVSFMDTGELEFPNLVDANDTQCFVMDRARFWLVPHDNASQVEPVHEKFGLDEADSIRSFPAFGPVPDSMVVVVGDDFSVTLWEGGEVRKLATLPGNRYDFFRCCWVENVILVFTGSHAWIIDAS